MLFIVLESTDHRKLLNSLSVQSIQRLMGEASAIFEEEYDCNHDKIIGTRLEECMNRLRRFIIEDQPFMLDLFVSKANHEYCAKIPCIKCWENAPCDNCYRITPFDIFNMKGARNRFIRSCRYKTKSDTGRHLCLKCYLG